MLSGFRINDDIVLDSLIVYKMLLSVGEKKTKHEMSSTGLSVRQTFLCKAIEQVGGI